MVEMGMLLAKLAMPFVFILMGIAGLVQYSKYKKKDKQSFIKCAHCGSGIQKGDKFCFKCGAPNLLRKVAGPVNDRSDKVVIMSSEARIVWMNVHITCYSDRFEIYFVKTGKIKVRDFSFILSVEKSLDGMFVKYKDTSSELITLKDGTKEEWIRILQSHITPF